MERQTEQYTAPGDQTIHEQGERIPKTDDPGKGPEGIVPNLEAHIVVGVFDRHQQADAAVRDLRAAGFSDTDISVVLQRGETAPETSADETKANQGTIAGVSAGAVLGGLAGLAALAIPGIGPLLAAGPLAVALGALTGGALGGLVGSFAGLGIPTERAEAYEAAVRAGGIVMAVRAADQEAEARVQQIMERHDARETSSYNQAL